MTKEQIIEIIKNKYEFWKDEKQKEFKNHGKTSFYIFADDHRCACGELLDQLKIMENKDA